MSDREWSQESARILVVDDNPASRYATSRVLRSANWTVLEAASGAEALELVQQNVDLVVLDVNLPDLDGFEVCRRIRVRHDLARIAVIHLSATFVTDTDKVRGLNVGADGYLVHPVEPPVLIATVRAFLRARHAEHQREQLLLSERTARAEADRANRIKDDFLATLSHELRTPLHAIIGWTELLKMGGLGEQERAEAIAVIDRNAKVQAQMIADLMDIASITSGKLRLHFQSVNPAAIIEAALLAIRPVAAAKKIEIHKDLQTIAEALSGDPDRLQQVIWNLVNNAVKFTPEGGRVGIVLRRRNEGVSILVSDTGPGIDPALLPVIFDRFQQGDASSTRKHGGLGIGLAIARQLVDLHGGRIFAESAGQGQGSTFTVELPLASDSPAAAAPLSRTFAHEPAQAIRLDRIRVLVVDDEHDARQMLTRTLCDRGAMVEGADSMARALETIARFHPQILLSDLGMPEHDGYELIRVVRSRGYNGTTLPAIALTGFARPEDRERALAAGYQAHLAKPVNPYELTQLIRRLVPGAMSD